MEKVYSVALFVLLDEEIADLLQRGVYVSVSLTLQLIYIPLSAIFPLSEEHGVVAIFRAPRALSPPPRLSAGLATEAPVTLDLIRARASR